MITILYYTTIVIDKYPLEMDNVNFSVTVLLFKKWHISVFYLKKIVSYRLYIN